MERIQSHDHSHGHSHEPPASLKNLIFAILINGGIVAFELAFGLLIQSMALISDAVHNLSDIAHMLFSYWAEKVARRPPNERKTYGYRKIEFIAAFVNSIGLSVVIAFIFWETLQRFAAPAEVPGRTMLWVAVVALAGNGAATLLLQRISARNINMKSAWLHSLQDSLFSLAVIVGALLIVAFGWRLVDPILSLIICLVIVREIYKIVRQAVNSLMDSVPPGIDFQKVRNDLLAIPAVAEVNDLHIWETGAEQRLLSAHLVSGEDSPDHEGIIRTAQEMLLHQYGINHRHAPDPARLGRGDGALQPLQLKEEEMGFRRAFMFGSLMIILAMMIKADHVSAADQNPSFPAYGSGPIEVRLYTDVEPLLRDLLRKNVIRLTLVDVPFDPLTPLFARYLLYTIKENNALEDVLKARNVLQNAANNKEIKTQEKIEALFREKGISFSVWDPKPAFDRYNALLKEDKINGTPTCAIVRDGQKKAFVGGPEIVNALKDLPKKGDGPRAGAVGGKVDPEARACSECRQSRFPRGGHHPGDLLRDL